MTNLYTENNRLPLTPVMKSRDVTTIYVRTTGNDSNIGSLDSPMLTLNNALQRIPDIVEQQITIDLGPGTFGTGNLLGRVLNAGSGITIKGTMDTATLASGATSGTSTGGDTTNLTLTGAGWTVNDLKGKYVYVNSELLLIKSNTATNLVTIKASQSTMSGKAFVIQESTTLVSGSIVVNGCHGGYVTVKNLKSTYAGYAVYSTFGTTGISMQQVSMSSVNGYMAYAAFITFLGAEQCYSKSLFGSYYAGYCQSVQVNNSIIEGGYYGTNIMYSNAVQVASCIIDGVTNAMGAIYLFNCYSLGMVSGSVSNTVSGSGLYLYKSSTGSTLTGTGNAKFGVNLDTDSVLRIYAGHSITGTTGDYSFNNTNARTWSTDFVSAGDVVMVPEKGCRVNKES